MNTRDQAAQEYYSNPSICKHCGKIIEPVNGQKFSALRRKKFCNSSCAASYNNKLKPKRIKTTSIKTKCPLQNNQKHLASVQR